MSYTSIWNHLKDVAKRIEREAAKVVSEEPAVIFVWDNINWQRRVVQSRVDNQRDMINATTRTLVVPRHVQVDLERHRPQKKIRELNSLDILPKLEDYVALYERRVFFVANLMVETFSGLKQLRSKIPEKWVSKPTKAVQKSRLVPLSMLHLNSGTISDTIKILDRTAKDFLFDKNSYRSVLCASDQSACKTAKAAKLRRRWEARDGHPVSGLKWALPWPQHFHCQHLFLKVYYSNLTCY